MNRRQLLLALSALPTLLGLRRSTPPDPWTADYDPLPDIEAAKDAALQNTGLTCNRCGLCEDCRCRLPDSWRLTDANGELLAEGVAVEPDFASVELSTTRLSDSSVTPLGTGSARGLSRDTVSREKQPPTVRPL